jgi:DNA-directed RNA polymerase subunit RPC12/RpoP
MILFFGLKKKMKKNQKPIDYDINLKYKCPSGCGNILWLSIQEAQTKNYKVVCDYCNTIFIPKRVSKFKILYDTIKKNIPDDLLKKCVDSLVKYGYTESDIERTAIQIYRKSQTDNTLELIKAILEKLNDKPNQASTVQ